MAILYFINIGKISKKLAHGEELMDFLRATKLNNKGKNPAPSIILLDLNMPKKDGREALKEIKSNDRYNKISTIMLTTSDSPSDIEFCYKHGVNSFLRKPSSFTTLVQNMHDLQNYLLNLVELPNFKAS